MGHQFQLLELDEGPPARRSLGAHLQSVDSKEVAELLVNNLCRKDGHSNVHCIHSSRNGISASPANPPSSNAIVKRWRLNRFVEGVGVLQREYRLIWLT